MPGPPTDYTTEKADIVIKALASGRRPASAAQAINVHRITLYRWREQFEDFAERWDHAIAEATDRLEEVVYGLALEGDLQAATYWLRHHRPNPYDRATLLKLGILQASLAAQQVNGGGGRVVVDLSADGLPLFPPPAASQGAKTMPFDGSVLEPIKVAMMPDNEREALVPPVCDGSGRTMPLPRRCMVFTRTDGLVMRMSADGKPVPPGAIPGLWERIQRYNGLCAVTEPVQSFTHSEARTVVAAMRARQWEADAREADSNPDREGDPEPRDWTAR